MTRLAIGLLAAAFMVLASVAALSAGESGGKAVASAKPSAEALAAALKNVRDAKKAVEADKKDEALAKLTEAISELEALSKAAPATTAAAEKSEGESFTGTVESTKSQKRPRLVVESVHYELHAAEKADAAVKETLQKISSGDATGTYVVKGKATTENGKPTLLVQSISKKE